MNAVVIGGWPTPGYSQPAVIIEPPSAPFTVHCAMCGQPWPHLDPHARTDSVTVPCSGATLNTTGCAR